MTSGTLFRQIRNQARCFLFAMLALLPIHSRAQTPVPQSAAAPIPRRLTLADAERILLDRNLAVVAAKYQVESSRAAKLIASYKPNPVLTVGAEQLALGHSASSLFKSNLGISAASTYTFRVDKIIERGGKRELRTEQADEQLKANEALMLDAVRTQLYQLRQSFTAATLAREDLLLAESTERQYEQTVTLTAAKVENGDLPGLEIYRVRAGQMQFEQAVVQARTSYELATRDVLNLLGATVADVEPASRQTAQATLPDGGKIVLAGNSPATIDDTQFSPSLRNTPLEVIAAFDDRPIVQTQEELLQVSLSERPDVMAARHIYEAANRGMSLAQAQRVRDISVGSEFQRVGSDSSFGATVSVPLFLYNNQRAAMTQAEAQRKASETLLRQAELQATTDVNKAYQVYLSARRTLDLYSKQNLSQVEKLRSIATLSYQEGASSLFELLDAQRTYNAALAAYNQARADYQNSLWQLEQAVGKTLR